MPAVCLVYGSEIHKLRAEGIDDSGSIFGRTDLAAIAGEFGLRAAIVTDASEFRPLFDSWRAEGTAEVWNVHVSGKASSPSTRRQLGRDHGMMQRRPAAAARGLSLPSRGAAAIRGAPSGIGA
jgi:hypothetical protein